MCTIMFFSSIAHANFFITFQLNTDDQILLLKACCMEIMCLRASCRYHPETNTLTLQNGLVINRSQLSCGGLGLLVEPIFDFAVGLHKLDLDSTEIALLAAVLLMQSGPRLDSSHENRKLYWPHIN